MPNVEVNSGWTSLSELRLSSHTKSQVFYSQILHLVHSLSFCVVEEEVRDALALDELERPMEEYQFLSIIFGFGIKSWPKIQ